MSEEILKLTEKIARNTMLKKYITSIEVVWDLSQANGMLQEGWQLHKTIELQTLWSVLVPWIKPRQGFVMLRVVELSHD